MSDKPLFIVEHSAPGLLQSPTTYHSHDRDSAVKRFNTVREWIISRAEPRKLRMYVIEGTMVTVLRSYNYNVVSPNFTF